MATLMERVQEVLEKEFLPKEILLEPAGRGMVDGWIISKSFDGLSDLARQQKIHELFAKYFNENERRRILTIFTLTPLEKRILIDEDPDGFELPSRKKSSSARKKTTTVGRKRNGVANRNRLAGNYRVARTR
jgi:acid stress-induced BolA-like protein IbaG/YrbA